MDVYTAAFLFFTALGVLAFLYVLHFRNRSLRMGAGSLRSALSRALKREEEGQGSAEETLREGALELLSHFRRWTIILSALLFPVFATCVLLTAFSRLPGLVLVLCGVGILLLSFLVSLLLLRDLVLVILADLDERKRSHTAAG